MMRKTQIKEWRERQLRRRCSGVEGRDEMDTENEKRDNKAGVPERNGRGGENERGRETKKHVVDRRRKGGREKETGNKNTQSG